MKRVYFAGELFDAKDLYGNAALAYAIREQSLNRYTCVLPQSLEQRETSAAAIRNADLRELFLSDAAIFHFDGNDADSGTVLEFSFAKMFDIPSVIVRTDFRSAGDNEKVPWNLMMSSFPRTNDVVMPSLFLYQDMLHRQGAPSSETAHEELDALSAAKKLTDLIAEKIIEALDGVCDQSPIMTIEEKTTLARLMPQIFGSGFDSALPTDRLLTHLESASKKEL